MKLEARSVKLEATFNGEKVTIQTSEEFRKGTAKPILDGGTIKGRVIASSYETLNVSRAQKRAIVMAVNKVLIQRGMSWIQIVSWWKDQVKISAKADGLRRICDWDRNL